MEVKGRNLSEGVPRSFTISSNEILEALTDPLNNIVSAVKNALEQTPPELGADIAERGMMLTGGGACCATWTACWPRKPACRCWWPKTP
jgi:rod shape-determining protein MreB